MGRQTNTNTNANKTTGSAVARISGIVDGFYDKGKKYDYITVRVDHSYDDYYDLFKVAVNKSFNVPDDGEPITLECNMKSYKGDVTFKEVNADTQ